MARTEWVCANLARTSKALSGFCLTALVAAMPAFSQAGSTGRITGAVSDQTGGVLAGATVSVTDTHRGTSRTLTTDQAGAYNAPELTPGTYTVKAQYAGFKATERQNVVVEVGKEYRVDLVVEPGAQSEQVTVAADLAPVETTNGVVGGTISNQLILELPVQGRNFQKTARTAPRHLPGPWKRQMES